MKRKTRAKKKKNKNKTNLVVHVNDFNPIAHLITTDNASMRTDRTHESVVCATSDRAKTTKKGMAYYLGSNTHIYSPHFLRECTISNVRHDIKR